jgi:hypothetical protein
MKSKKQNPFLVAALTVAGVAFTASSTFAAALTWDITAGDGTTITAGSGNWNTTAGNTVWNSAGTNVIWSQTSTTDGSNSATFAGADGTLNQYVITLAAQMAAESITFSNSGYQIHSWNTSEKLLTPPSSVGLIPHRYVKYSIFKMSQPLPM